MRDIIDRSAVSVSGAAIFTINDWAWGTYKIASYRFEMYPSG